MVIIVIIIILIILIVLHPLENFTHSIKEYIHPNIDTLKKINTLDSFDFVYCKHDGIYTIFSGNIVYKNKTQDFIKNKLELDSIKTGYYNYTHNYICILNNNNIYKYDLFSNTISMPTFFKDFFKGVSNIDCMFYLENKVYIFSNNDTIIYDLLEHKIINQIETNKLFNNCPKKIDCAFLNYNDIIKYDSLPYLYILNGKTYYKYNINNTLFEYIGTGKFNYNHTNQIIRNNKDFKVEHTAIYRIILVGGGIESGGYGGMIYNDLKLIKNDKYRFILGGSGQRIPVKNNLMSHARLPLTGSCSGAGGTSLLKKNEAIMVAGGGGGWVSELIKSPNSCNSIKYNERPNKPSLYFPIKKIVVESQTGQKDIHYKINISNFEVEDKNNESTMIYIHETPEPIEKTYLYETLFSYSPTIEFEFENVLTDYSISLDYSIDTTHINGHINSNVIFYDEQNRKYSINNFNSNFEGKLTGKNLLNYFSKNNSPKVITKLNTNNSNNRLLHLEGGQSGKFSGNDSISDKFDNLNCCGGGGGWIKGDNVCLDKTYCNKTIYPTDYVGACGGTSYIKDLSIKNPLFIHNYNQDTGYAVIIKHQ